MGSMDDLRKRAIPASCLVDENGNTYSASAGGAIPAGSNIIGRVGIDQTTPGTTNGVQVNAALPAGTNLVGKFGIDQTTPGTTNLVAMSSNAADFASTASLSSAVSAAASAQLLAANAARKGLILVNTDANDCYVKYGTTSSATSFTAKIPNNGYWEMPKPIYTGRIDVIWSAAGSGSLYATEL